MSGNTQNDTQNMTHTADGTKKRRSAIQIMGRLIGLVRPLLPIMCLAIILGIAGYLCAIFLTILAGYELIRGLLMLMGASIIPAGTGLFAGVSTKGMFALLILMAVCRGLLHYGEQYCNHFIAFKLLAIIRHKVFAVLRKLCPAKLEGRDKGNLISLITSDIELLEVFYAHTISPIAIAAAISILMTIFIGSQHPLAGVLALAGYIVVGVCIPLIMGRAGADRGMEYRTAFGDLNSFILDGLHGLDESIQYGCGEKRLAQMNQRSRELGEKQNQLNHLEAIQRSVTNLAILGFSFGMLFLMIHLNLQGAATFSQTLIAVIAMMGSFGPVVALSNLSNNLNQTLASGERVLSLLEEEPQVAEVSGQPSIDTFTGAEAAQVDFSYGDEQILSDYNLTIPKGSVVGLHGASGSGKSTLLKLFMRFWDDTSGQICISGRDIRDMNTTDLRDMESYVTQETWLFHDTLANNIAIGRPGASREEIIEAAKKASIHDFISSLPDGYDTQVGELGDTLSGGERQRIGIARTFLADNDFWLLDEPTSNLDALNEGIILKSLQQAKADKTILLVSHRMSTMNLADIVYHMDSSRKS